MGEFSQIKDHIVLYTNFQSGIIAELKTNKQTKSRHKAIYCGLWMDVSFSKYLKRKFHWRIKDWVPTLGHYSDEMRKISSKNVWPWSSLLTKIGEHFSYRHSVFIFPDEKANNFIKQMSGTSTVSQSKVSQN